MEVVGNIREERRSTEGRVYGVKTEDGFLGWGPETLGVKEGNKEVGPQLTSKDDNDCNSTE